MTGVQTCALPIFLKIISDFIGREATMDDVAEISKKKISDIEGYVGFSKSVAESVKDYNEFAREWREHFVETMKPQFMPNAWKIDRKTGKVWVPRRIREQHKNQFSS